MARWKKLLCINSHHIENVNFLFLSLFVYLFKYCPSQFLSRWESAEPMFCCEKLTLLPYKNQNKGLTLNSWWENSNFAVCLQQNLILFPDFNFGLFLMEKIQNTKWNKKLSSTWCFQGINTKENRYLNSTITWKFWKLIYIYFVRIRELERCCAT